MKNEEIDLSNIQELILDSWNSIPKDLSRGTPHIYPPTHNLPFEYDSMEVREQKNRELVKEREQETLLKEILFKQEELQETTIVPVHYRNFKYTDYVVNKDLINMWKTYEAEMYKLPKPIIPKPTFWQKLKNLFI